MDSANVTEKSPSITDSNGGRGVTSPPLGGIEGGLPSLRTTLLIATLIISIYLILLPFVHRTWRTTGDEPHYLLAAHSLVTDSDFDLTNNYTQLDYLNFYLSQDIAPQIRLNPAGQQILNHQLGLSVLIAPAYAVANRFGVLLFQALLGGLLAAVTFRLAATISRDEQAAFLATLFVSLSPLLLIYPYLVYPELIAALLVTTILYYLISRDEASLGVALLVVAALILLPWLNRRFWPLALLLAGMVAWIWRGRGAWKSWISPIGVASLLLTGLSLAVLLWFNSQLSAPTRTDFVTPDGVLIWNRLSRGIGWLLDQQRGLLIYAPIYIFALWGLPYLIQNSLSHRRRDWIIVIPFFLSLGVTSAAGGFWVAWELGPRFLVVALPALAPLIALAWRYYRQNVALVLFALLLFAISVVNSWVIIQNPELPYKSSLALFYGEKLGLPLTEILPDLAGYATIAAVEGAPQVLVEAGEPVWAADAGNPTRLLQTEPLYELPFGHYQLSWSLQTDSPQPPDTELVRLSIKFLGGGSLLNHNIMAAEIPSAGTYHQVSHSFLNTNVDRWRTPMVLSAVSSGATGLQAGVLRFQPDPFYAVVLPYLYLTILIAAALLTWVWSRRSRVSDVNNNKLWNAYKPFWPVPAMAIWGIIGVFPLIAVGYVATQQTQTSRVYDVNEFLHFVGQPIADAAAEDGRAWRVDPAIDPPQKAIYGPFDIYEPGRYQVTFLMKATDILDTDQALARLQVNATANFEELVTQTLEPKHFSKPDLYHHFVLPVDNPRRQALSFDVHYLGVAPLVIDGVLIEKVAD
ncbi:MAG: hypothetical protein AAF485_01300 [Chloroflexota bacterium]